MTSLVLHVVVAQFVKTTSGDYRRDRDMFAQREQTRVQVYCNQVKGFFRDAGEDA